MTRHLTRAPVLAGLLVVTVAVLLTGGVALTRGPEPSVEAFCAQVAGAQDLDESLAGFDPAAVRSSVGALREAGAVAPDEIAAQVDEVLALAEALETTITTSGGDKASGVEQVLRERADRAAAVDAAGTALENYTEANCALRLNGTASPSEAPVPK